MSAGKKARLFSGRCLEIGDAESTIEPDEDGYITMRYVGALNNGQTRQIAYDVSRHPNGTGGD